jgi:hypothetical protein
MESHNRVLEGYHQLVSEKGRTEDSVKSLDLQGDITALDFPDRCFNIDFCTEVLEHVPALEEARAELMRVAKHMIVVGVPNGRICGLVAQPAACCDKNGPPWGHVNSFDEETLERLFQPWIPVKKTFVGENRERTNALAAWLMDWGGNPWGIYENQICIHCGGPLAAPEHRSLPQKCIAATALRLTKLTTLFSQPHSNWIHIVFQRNA